MKNTFIFALVVCVSHICSAQNTSQGDQKFDRQVFKAAGSGTTFTLISNKECEIENGRDIVLGEYSREGDKLRVVFRGTSGARVVYYYVFKFGIREPDWPDRTFLSPEAFARVQEQMRRPVLGASEDDLASWFGKPTYVSPDRGSPFTSCSYEPNGFLTLIHAEFRNGRAEMVQYETHEDISSGEEVGLILNANSSGQQWQMTSHTPDRTEFRRSDGMIATVNASQTEHVVPRTIYFFTPAWQEHIFALQRR